MIRFDWLCVAVMSLDYPVLRPEQFDEWPSFTWEFPLFWWFFGIAIVLGIMFGMILRVVRKQNRIMSLSIILPVRSQGMGEENRYQARLSAGSVTGS